MTKLLKKVAIIFGSLIAEGMATIWILFAAFDIRLNPMRVAAYGNDACTKGFWMVLIIGLVSLTICDCWSTITMLRMTGIENAEELA